MHCHTAVRRRYKNAFFGWDIANFKSEQWFGDAVVCINKKFRPISFKWHICHFRTMNTSLSTVFSNQSFFRPYTTHDSRGNSSTHAYLQWHPQWFSPKYDNPIHDYGTDYISNWHRFLPGEGNMNARPGLHETNAKLMWLVAGGVTHRCRKRGMAECNTQMSECDTQMSDG